MLILASALLQNLERELRQMERGHRPDGMMQLCDVVYLPRLITLSEKANRYAESADWQLLSQSLHQDLAEAKIRVVVEMLRLLQMAQQFQPSIDRFGRFV